MTDEYCVPKRFRLASSQVKLVRVDTLLIICGLPKEKSCTYQHSEWKREKAPMKVLVNVSNCQQVINVHPHTKKKIKPFKKKDLRVEIQGDQDFHTLNNNNNSNFFLINKRIRIQ